MIAVMNIHCLCCMCTCTDTPWMKLRSVAEPSLCLTPDPSGSGLIAEKCSTQNESYYQDKVFYHGILYINGSMKEVSHHYYYPPTYP